MTAAVVAQAHAYADAKLPVIGLHGIGPDGTCTCPDGQSCEHPGKHPDPQLSRHGFKSATCNHAVIDRWPRTAPRFNVGIAIPKNIVVLDVDDRAGGWDTWMELFVELGGELADTVAADTPGDGMHSWHLVPPDARLRKGAGVLGPGLDVLRDAVAAPPSRGANGRQYAWLPECSPLERRPRPLPEAVLERLRVPEPPPRPAPVDVFRHHGAGSSYGLRALELECAAVASAVEHTRNDTLNKAGFALGQLVASGHLDEDVVRRELTVAAEAAGLR